MSVVSPVGAQALRAVRLPPLARPPSVVHRDTKADAAPAVVTVAAVATDSVFVPVGSASSSASVRPRSASPHGSSHSTSGATPVTVPHYSSTTPTGASSRQWDDGGSSVAHRVDSSASLHHHHQQHHADADGDRKHVVAELHRAASVDDRHAADAYVSLVDGVQDALEAVTESVMESCVTPLLLYVLPDIAQQQWKHFQPFFKGKRVTYGVQVSP